MARGVDAKNSVTDRYLKRLEEEGVREEDLGEVKRMVQSFSLSDRWNGVEVSFSSILRVCDHFLFDKSFRSA
jgi:hypothetical protein